MTEPREPIFIQDSHGVWMDMIGRACALVHKREWVKLFEAWQRPRQHDIGVLFEYLSTEALRGATENRTTGCGCPAQIKFDHTKTTHPWVAQLPMDVLAYLVRHDGLLVDMRCIDDNFSEYGKRSREELRDNCLEVFTRYAAYQQERNRWCESNSFRPPNSAQEVWDA